MTSRPPAPERDRPRPFRPALVTLSDDISERIEELRAGLKSESRVLTWLQEVTIRTLGRVDREVYADLSRQFRGDQGALLATMLRPAARRREHSHIDDDTAERVRENLIAEYIMPAHQRAFRRLRQSATEYVDAADGTDDHNPERQSWIAMRPALNELEEWQQRTLSSLLDGFEERGDLLEWSPDVVLATHGEVSEEWVTRVYREDSTAAALLGNDQEDQRARRLFAAHYLLPHFRAGVRVLAGEAGEMPDSEPPDQEVPRA